ncbi:MAG: c-type cytochrome [Bacteroidia bacterium]|nr:MAG: c-type cytochrome [Bacteroidia bacterium]
MKILKWIGIILLFLVGIVCGVVFFMVNKADNILSKKYTVEPVKVTLPTDSISLARGKLLASGCYECHGDHLEGKVFFEDPSIGTVYSPNLTMGKGSVVANFSDKDWVRAVRNGVAPDGRGLFIMPSQDFHAMSEQDLGAVLAYLKTVAAVDNEHKENNMKLFGKLLIGLGAFGDVIPAETIDPNEGFKASYPMIGVTKEYGNYLVDISGCKSCHGKELNGMDTGDPNSPPGSNLTPSGNLAHWSETDFINTFRTGKTPEGKELIAKYMPWKAISNYPDDHLAAIYQYLKSLPKKETGYK